MFPRRLEPSLPLPPTPHHAGAARPSLEVPTDPARALRYGVDLWNAGCAWEAHEAWEACWRVAAEPGEREALQGLVQLAAARHAAAAGRDAGAARLRERARRHLAAGAGAEGAAGRLAASAIAALDAGGGAALDPDAADG